MALSGHPYSRHTQRTHVPHMWAEHAARAGGSQFPTSIGLSIYPPSSRPPWTAGHCSAKVRGSGARRGRLLTRPLLSGGPYSWHQLRFWRKKVHSNQERDKRDRRALRKLGWKVLHVWKCQLTTAPKREATLARIATKLGRTP